jgi:hypothetical protein
MMVIVRNSPLLHVFKQVSSPCQNKDFMKRSTKRDCRLLKHMIYAGGGFLNDQPRSSTDRNVESKYVCTVFACSDHLLRTSVRVLRQFFELFTYPMGYQGKTTPQIAPAMTNLLWFLFSQNT